MSLTIEKDKRKFPIKWFICGSLEMIYVTSELVVFSKYDLEFLTESFVILNIICDIVKSLASIIFIATFHKKVSAYSIPILTGIVTHSVIIPILAYYTFSSLITKGLNADQIAIMSTKFIWFVYEIFFTYYLLKYWNEIQNSKSSKKRLNWNKRPNSKLDAKSKKILEFQQNKLKGSEEYLNPDTDQKKRYIQNQLYIYKCLKQNAKISNQKLPSQRNVIKGQSLEETELYRVKSKSIQSKSSNQYDQSVEEDKLAKKQKQLQFIEITPAKDVETNTSNTSNTNNQSKKDTWDESEEASVASVEKKTFYF